MVKKRKHKKFVFTKKQAILTLIALCFVAGLAVGIISVKSLDGAYFNEISVSIKDYLHSFNNINNADKMDRLRESIFKHTKLVIIIWLLGFIPAGGFIVFILLLVKGAGYGFTTGLLIEQFGFYGAITAAIVYLPQSIIIIPTYFFTSYCSINYILFNINNNKEKDSSFLKEYFCILLICCLFAILTSLLEVYVVPNLVKSAFLN